MPPRIPAAQSLGTFSLCLRPASKPPTPTQSFLPLTQTASLSQKEKKKFAKQQPYRWAQMQQRKAAHVKRREEIEVVRTSQRGDPVRGLTTPFVESFDSAGQAPMSKPPLDDEGNPLEEPHPLPTSPHVYNHLIHKSEMDAAIANAYILTEPFEPLADSSGDTTQARQAREESEEATRRHQMHHERVVEALERIAHMDKGSAKAKLHANIRRCVENFGRHETDLTLRPKALSRGQEREEKPVRGGPDTGSSEVQIAILTAKIRALANELEKGRGYKDKVGKRDLRLMVHRRQRLLQYMERKERGSDRWKHMIETLGLSEATYKGQITL